MAHSYNTSTCKIVQLYTKQHRLPRNLEYIINIYYIQKGDKNNCNNYRGISLSICLSKLFTGLLQNRLITHLENFFSPLQAGFRPDHRTTDHIFAIKR